ncbi:MULTISPECIES: MarR family transcriptional regulator [Streptomyces]|uniref:MarR family winged helix-turn-helix transcriptional regulator n=1 Tax=Streptomyces luteosporeus TaxID=173856 RepID=A0ABN3TQ10_9ACTN
MPKSDQQEEAVAAVERAMVAIRRSQTRRSLARLASAEGGRQVVDPTLFGVLDAVEERGRSCTVTDVAAALGVDQPRASRLVLRAVEDGLLTRHVDPADRRRTLLELTASGKEQLQRAQRVRRAVFGKAMASWPESDRSEFARLITAFVASFGQVMEGEGK